MADFLILIHIYLIYIYIHIYYKILLKQFLKTTIKFGLPFTGLDSGDEKNRFDDDGEDEDAKRFVGVVGFSLIVSFL